jgi:hypothetical protein
VRRYFVKVDLQVETDNPGLIPVEVQGRLLDGTGRPPGVRIEDANVVSMHEIEGEPLPE